MLWVIFALLTGAAVFSVLWPLSRKPAGSDPRELDVAFYKTQLAEIDRDATRGVIGADDVASARTEAARRLVSASNRQADVTSRSMPILIVAVAVLAVAFVPAAALGLYWQIGAPNMPDAPLEARLAAPPDQMDVATAIAKIEQHLATHPDDGRGWTILGPIYVRLQRYDDAIRAFTNANRILGPNADRYAAIGEAQIFVAGGGVVTADAKKSFEEALKLDPRAPRAAFYLGLAAQQDGDKAKALDIWKKLVADSPPDAPWLPTVRAHIAEASGEAPPLPMAQGPSQAPGPGPGGPRAAAVAAMAPEQQQAMIHRMVDGLAARLKSNGNDIEGWLRLVRAYRVLNEGDKAKVALADARKNFAADAAAKKRLDELAHELGLEG